jgi:fatty-acyl-CoA synthase
MTADGPNRSVSRTWLRALELTAGLDAAPTQTLPVRLAALAQENGAAPALIDESGVVTFAELAARAEAAARWARGADLQPGACVGLMMGNCADYVAIWLGLSGYGLVVALLNTNLRGNALAHCLTSAGCVRVIADPPGTIAVRDATPEIAQCVYEARDVLDIERLERDGPNARDVTLDETALLIYTSGTTGLPKAARVSHRRLLTWSLWFAGLMNVTPQDRMYNCLPMYHSVGGVVAVGSMLVAGGSVAIAEKFSASRFWHDIVRHDCTVFQYIGELARYLVAASPSPYDRAHKLRLCCGNGLRADVWEAFAARFEIPQILEFYAATEGNFSLFNVEGRPGAIGRVPSFLAHRFPIALVAFDARSEMPLRETDGFCRRVQRGNVGEAIGRVNEGARFEGYTDPAATAKKLLRDVFESGDLWLRTGDLMRQDEQGFFYFVDRVGDTFRWKGENVSSAEVADAIAACPGVVTATVYGVAVSANDGRAGMAALVVESDFDLANLAVHLFTALPVYARPVFLRLQRSLSQTSTFKPQKAALIAESYDPAAVSDPLYVFENGSYMPLDAARYEHIQAGGVRL